MFTASLLIALSGCDRSGLPLRPVLHDDIPYLDDLGEIEVVPPETWGVYDPIYQDESPKEDCTDGVDNDDQDDLADCDDDNCFHHPACGGDGAISDCLSAYDGHDNGAIYTSLSSPPDPSIIGGAVAEFRGTGGPVCVVVDPEAVSWQQAISSTSSEKNYYYADDLTDDGDLDISVGLSAYYTGSPGVEMGDFLATYTDGVGGVHEIPFQECFPGGYDYHAGRGTVEYCDIDTSGRYGISYTIQMKNFMVPIDDSVLQYAVAVFEGTCDDAVSGSVIDSANPDNNRCGVAHGGGVECALRAEGESGDGAFTALELAYCGLSERTNKDLYDYCSEHLDDEDPACFLGYWETHPPPSEDTDTTGG